MKDEPPKQYLQENEVLNPFSKYYNTKTYPTAPILSYFFSSLIFLTNYDNINSKTSQMGIGHTSRARLSATPRKDNIAGMRKIIKK